MEARRRIYNASITKNVVSHPGLEEFAKAKRRARAARAVVEAARKEADARIKLKRLCKCNYLWCVRLGGEVFLSEREDGIGGQNWRTKHQRVRVAFSALDTIETIQRNRIQGSTKNAACGPVGPVGWNASCM